MNMNKSLAILGASALLISCAFAQSAPKVSVKFPAKAKAGQSVAGTVLVTIPSGLHAYQNPPSKDYMIPLTVSVATKGVKLKSAKYPAGKPEQISGESAPVRVYEGTVRIPVTVVVPKKHGKVQVAFTVHYQECNQSSCFRPGDVTAITSLNVQ